MGLGHNPRIFFSFRSEGGATLTLGDMVNWSCVTGYLLMRVKLLLHRSGKSNISQSKISYRVCPVFFLIRFKLPLPQSGQSNISQSQILVFPYAVSRQEGGS